MKGKISFKHLRTGAAQCGIGDIYHAESDKCHLTVSIKKLYYNDIVRNGAIKVSILKC